MANDFIEHLPATVEPAPAMLPDPLWRKSRWSAPIDVLRLRRFESKRLLREAFWSPENGGASGLPCAADGVEREPRRAGEYSKWPTGRKTPGAAPASE